MFEGTSTDQAEVPIGHMCSHQLGVSTHVRSVPGRPNVWSLHAENVFFRLKPTMKAAALCWRPLSGLDWTRNSSERRRSVGSRAHGLATDICRYQKNVKNVCIYIYRIM